MADEGAQESEGSWRQVDCLPGTPQHRIGLVELELAEAHAQRAGVTASHGYIVRDQDNLCALIVKAAS